MPEKISPLFQFDKKIAARFHASERRYQLPRKQSPYKIIAGIDEAGRGPLAGPVVASAVALPPGFYEPSIRDSKKLSPQERARLSAILKEKCYWAIGTADPALIDSINILQATYHAMKAAVQALLLRYPDLTPDLVLIDGKCGPNLGRPQNSIIGGDNKSAAIASASIIAKVTRDEMMLHYHALYPQYQFHRHKGYGTELHLEMLGRFGPSPIHRKSFSPVRNLFKNLTFQGR